MIYKFRAVLCCGEHSKISVESLGKVDSTHRRCWKKLAFAKLQLKREYIVKIFIYKVVQRDLILEHFPVEQMTNLYFYFSYNCIEPFATPFREIKAKQNLLIKKGIYNGGLVKFDL